MESAVISPPRLTVEYFTPDKSYESIYQRQKNLVDQRIHNQINDTFLLGEHSPVITLGRGTHPENLLHNPTNIPIIEIERGGDVTYHGPGQLVGYPIFKLNAGQRDLHAYLRKLEQVLIDVLALYNLPAIRRPGWTGVWVGEQKIASIGVAVKKWVTYHGFALNVDTDLNAFSAINPCGLPPSVMTSLHQQLNIPIHKATLCQDIISAFEKNESGLIEGNSSYPTPGPVTN